MQKTEFAPAERQNKEAIDKENALLMKDSMLPRLLDSVNNIVLILNNNRQTIYYNKNLLGICDPEESEILGKRPGELVGCIHAGESEGGCGTTKFCKECGAVKAILSAQKGNESIDECRIIIKNEEKIEALDLRVKATPINIEDHEYTIFSIEDIGDEKRREVLENIFFHDILNTANGIKGFSELLVSKVSSKEEDDIKKAGRFSHIIHNSSNNLISEIMTQRDLARAENNELETKIMPFSSRELIENVADLFAKMADDAGATIIKDTVDIMVKTDSVLFSRVLANMVKNAIEASGKSETVTISSRAEKENLVVSVHNHAVMPEKVQLQIFQRSYSTKGKGRGIGTYSMIILTERYLKGRVSFSSADGKGTTFTMRIPLALQK